MFKGIGGNFSFFDEFNVSKQNNSKWDAAFALGRCLPISHKKAAMLIWDKCNIPIQLDSKRFTVLAP